MILGLTLLALVSLQVFQLTRGWWGTLAPDLVVPVVAFAALHVPRRGLLLVAVAIGWLRALVLLEPAGGQILCVWAAVALVAASRSVLPARRPGGFVMAAAVTAGTWVLAARGLDALGAPPPTGGRELLLGAAAAIPLARPAVAAAGRRP